MLAVVVDQAQLLEVLVARAVVAMVQLVIQVKITQPQGRQIAEVVEAAALRAAARVKQVAPAS